MTTPSGNPFVFPGMGLGQTPEHLAGNPLLQSFEMMRNAWSSMGSQMLSGGIPTPPLLNIEELDKRIAEMRAVENWLRLNLTMLQGSIQAMEVQRATIATLHSFASMGAAGIGSQTSSSGTQPPSPLEVALGMKGAQAGAASSTQPEKQPSPPDRSQGTGDAKASSATSGEPAAPTPQQAWWNMLQNQFNQLASAAAATLTPDATGAAAAARPEAPADAASQASPAKAARKTTKTAARKSAPRKS